MFTLELARQQASLARESPSRPDWAYVLTTSGTTGRRKLVPRSHRQLALYAQSLSECYHVAANDVGCHLVPMHHSHGLDAALMIPLQRGASVVCLPEFDIQGFFAALDEYRVTWLTAVFTVYREILRRAPDFCEAVAKNRLRFMRVGSGCLGPDEIDRIERTFGAPLLMGFGMTEARMITHDPLPPRMRKRGSVGVPLRNQVAIMSEAGAICATGYVGEVVVRGPLVFDGYFDDAQATAAAFVDGWFRTGDLGRFDEDGFLYLVGRIKDLINRGGEKISPVEIDAVIESHPDVYAAATFGVPHPTLGQEVVAAVVRKSDAAVGESEIIDRVRAQMGPLRTPRCIYFLDELPRTDSGKIRRSELSSRFGAKWMHASSIGETSVPATQHSESPLEAALTGLWSSVLEVSPVGMDDDFFLLGGDSLRAARLLTAVKSLFGIDLPIESMFHGAATVAGMARTIEQALNANIDHG
ncbi:MAG: AMP-binding protein [Burkholderiales bacterium]